MATVSHTPPPTQPRGVPGPLKLAGQFTLGVLFLLSVLLLGWTVFDYATSRFVSADATRVEERKKILTDRVTEDYKYLHDAPGWFKKDQGLVRVPIDEAMRLTLPLLQADKPHAAYPIATPPMDSGAPTSPDKGVGSTPGVTTNPAASNPTTGHPVPTPAPSATPGLPVPGSLGSPLSPTPAPGNAAVAPPPQPTATPAPSATAAPTAPAASGNNAANPGSAPIPGTHAEPMPAPAPEVTPTPAAKAAPLATPPAQPTPTGTAPVANGPAPTPTPGPNEPGANPAGTP